MQRAHREKELIEGYRTRHTDELDIIAVAVFGPTEAVERLTAGMELYGR